jgi:stage III sporulation protein AG
VTWSALKPRDKTLIRYLILAVAVGLLLMSLRSLGSPGSPQPAAAAPAPARGALEAEEATLSSDLAAILSQVAGAGSVRVRVALGASDRQVYAVDHTTDSTTTQGAAAGAQPASTQTQSSERTVTVGNGALPVEVRGARVDSVLVVASGASDPAVAAALARAAAAALGVPLYEVVVLPGV